MTDSAGIPSRPQGAPLADAAAVLQGETSGWNLLYTNTNPRPETICADCRMFIGYVFDVDSAPSLPLHPSCYCVYKPVHRGPTWPPNDAPEEWDTWEGFFAWHKANKPKRWRRWIQRAARLLRIGAPLGILKSLEEAARRYNEEEYEPRQQDDDQDRESAIKEIIMAFSHNPRPALRRPRRAQGGTEGNRPTNPQNAAQSASGGAQSRTTVEAGHITLQPTSEDAAVYDAILVTPGWIRQDDGESSDWLIPADVLQDAVDRELFSALPHYVDHPDQFGFGWHQRPSVRDLAGVAEEARWDPEANAVRAAIRLYDTEAGRLLAALYDRIIADKEAGRDVPPLGLSITCYRDYDYDEETGEKVWTHIRKVSSVDAVYEPGAAGYIRAALSTLQTDSQPTGGTMADETRTQTSPETTQDPPAAETEVEEVQNSQELTSIQSNIDELNAAVDRLNGLLADQEERNTVRDMGEAPRGPMLFGGLQGLDQVELAVEAMIKGTRPPEGVRPLTGIRELYMLLSGDYELTGRYHDDRVHLANVTTSTMANIVADALNKVVVNMFQDYDQWWNPAVTVRDFASLQDAKWITLGGVGELPTVAEGAAYTEMTWDDQKETDSFVKKGGYLGITLETIDKDDTARVMAAPRALAQAAWLTLGKSIAEIFTANSGYGPAMSDGNNLIDSSNHSNEGSTALSYSAWQATKIAMMKQTELNSGERLGALARPRLLWAPIDLEDTAIEILAAGEGEIGSADYHVNPEAAAEGLRERIRSARNRVITVPFWTDVKDWVAQADPNMYPSIGLGFRYGRSPEIFSVADPRAGLMFTNDTMPIKVRFFYAVGPTDWRGVYKHLVT